MGNLSRPHGSMLCVICSNAVAFSTPFHASPRVTELSSSQKCSWTTIPVIQTRVSSFRGRRVVHNARREQKTSEFERFSPKAMFSGGGFLGVGPSEVIVIVAVGWILLGPQKLLSLAKDSGKLLGQLRRTADEARSTFKEALDLDMIAAEADALSRELQSTPKRKSATKGDEDEVDGVSDTMSGRDAEIKANSQAEAPDLTTPGPDILAAETNLPGSEPESDMGGSEAFLDQLRRVSDPNQVAPSEVPDPSTDVDELEVERLEREYMEAKRKLEERRAQANIERCSDVKPGMEGR